ncbi:hypothetical protein Q8G35_12420 [Peribacillus simplex]|uniref:Uncharacterized protein n=2 Tax=Peribacillus TaxID=2675229 RepID=A0AA90P4K8_9BACI|nr:MULTISPECIES: hypothetical protein [Peribacillus]MDP1419216.1 hypothetical protein [Peribacillus simplex]MDP1452146.1 hypothetical protein [Peribacillus frigoritolerans]
MSQKRFTVTYNINGANEKTVNIWVDTLYTMDIEHMIKVELNESIESNIGIDKINLIKF